MDVSVIAYAEMHDKLLVSVQTGIGAPDISDVEQGRFGGYLKLGQVGFVDLSNRLEQGGHLDTLVASRLALLINQPRVKHKHLFRTAFFLPMLTSGVVIAIMFTLIFDHEYGALNNYVMAPLGIEKIRRLRDPAFVMPSIIIVGLWKYTGINTLYFLVGLQNTPTEIREAALIDGASPGQRFVHVTLPMLKPILTF